MPQPNSSIASAMTMKDANGNLLSNLSACSVVVLFPDGTTTTLSLGSGVVNSGGGVYTASYSTKGVGEVLEVWSVTAVDGVTKGNFENVVPVSY